MTRSAEMSGETSRRRTLLGKRAAAVRRRKGEEGFSWVGVSEEGMRSEPAISNAEAVRAAQQRVGTARSAIPTRRNSTVRSAADSVRASCPLRLQFRPANDELLGRFSRQPRPRGSSSFIPRRKPRSWELYDEKKKT